MGRSSGHEVVRGVLRPGLSAHDPEVLAALDRWPGSRFLAPLSPDGTAVVLVRRTGPAVSSRLWLHGLLLALTLLTTLLAGALLRGVDPLGTRFVRLPGLWLPVPTGLDLAELLLGVPFAVPFLVILLGHELGHWLAARVHRIPATLPYFIPFPPYFSIVGTLGAFIRLRGPLVRRSILLDVGVTGPVASFLLSLPVLAVGLALSRPVEGPVLPGAPFVILFAGEPFWVGAGALFAGAAWLFFPDALGVTPVLLHPVAFAGWLGLFVTALNLLPFGQLDGGHVLYAAVGGAQRWAGVAFLAALLPLGALWWGWWLWGAAALILSRGRVAHPPLLQEEVPLDRRRRWLAWAAVAVFFLTFVPIPVRL